MRVLVALGGYALLHPGARVLTLIFLIFFITLIEVPAVVLLGIWFVLQFLPAIGQTAVTDLAGGDSIAYLAHVGGFIFGLAAIRLFAHSAGASQTSRRASMTQAVELLVLVQRLRREAARQGDSELAIDLRLACRHLRRYAAQWIALEAERTRDLGAQRRPIAEAGASEWHRA